MEVTNAGLRQHWPQVPSSAPSISELGASHQWKTHGASAIVGFLYELRLTLQAAPLLPLRGFFGKLTEWNLPAHSSALTWLCSGGKISGTPVAISALEPTPTTKTITRTPVKIRIFPGHADTLPAVKSKTLWTQGF